MNKYLITYLLVMNVIGILVMAMDKHYARTHHYRIPERILWLVTLLGGGLGTTSAMWLFHHKSNKLHFMIGFPLIAVVEIVLFYGILIP